MIDRLVDNYGDWIDRSKHQLVYLKLTGMIKKDEKLHVTQLFCASKVIDDEMMEGEGIEIRNTEDAGKLFNPQVLFDTCC